MSVQETIKFIEKNKVLVICRGVYGDDLIKTIEALHKGGVNMAEVTFDQSDPDAIAKTCGAIESLVREFPDMRVGSGTVTKIEHVIATREAGGAFCLSPHTDVELVRAENAAGLVAIPGATTASEIMAAHNAGADFVKIFPAGWLGLKYIKDLRGPINHVKFLATGGVTEENFTDYLDAGFSGAGISSRLLDRKVIAAGDFDELTRRAAAFSEIAASR